MHQLKYFAMRVMGISAALIYAPFAMADATTAVTALYQNMSAIGVRWSTTQNNTLATPTLVRGVYIARTRSSGEFLGYITENGKIVGDSRGWRIIGRGPMNGSDIAELRQEILRNIDLSKLVKVEYGDGGGRKMVLFSAVDCPFCKKFEDSAAKLTSDLNTTFYVVPTALRPQNSRVATNIWCAKKNGEAWRTYWATMKPPIPQSCAFDDRTAETMRNQLDEILSSVGIRVTGVPAILREDGKLFTPEPMFNKNYAASVFSRKALSDINSVHDGGTPKWLASSIASADDASSENASVSDNGPGNLGEALQKLFRR